MFHLTHIVDYEILKLVQYEYQLNFIRLMQAKSKHVNFKMKALKWLLACKCAVVSWWWQDFLPVLAHCSHSHKTVPGMQGTHSAEKYDQTHTHTNSQFSHLILVYHGDVVSLFLEVGSELRPQSRCELKQAGYSALCTIQLPPSPACFPGMYTQLLSLLLFAPKIGHCTI